MAELGFDMLGFDMLEQILIRLDVEDLIQCKRVCKSWYSFVLSPCFVKSHLNRSHANDLNTYGRTRRIMMAERGSCRIVGSANGLVCVYLKDDDQLLVTNPSTREVKLLPPPCPPLCFTRDTSCWGFGYDSSIDDYKVIVGSMRNEEDHTRFYAITLKSNVWRLIDRVKYMLYHGRSGRSGILCDGALHWFMRSYHENERKVILSLNLSSEEFKEIPQPDYTEEISHRLGCLRGRLLICKRKRAKNNHKMTDPSKTWSMRKYNVKQSWLLMCQFYSYVMQPDPVYYLKTPWRAGIREDHVRCLDVNWGVYATAPIFVKSLVSPHIDRRPRETMQNLVSFHGRTGETTDNKRSAIGNSSYNDISGSPPSSRGILDRKRKWQPEN